MRNDADSRQSRPSLLFEFNANSPLFALVADEALEAGDASGALGILQKGIVLYPDYPSAYYVYAKCLASLGMFNDAAEMAKKASKITGDEKSLEYYLSYIEQKRSGLEPDKEDSQSASRIEELANLLSSAKLKTDEETEEPAEILEKEPKKKTLDMNFTGNKIVSETLAGIYYAQGNLAEALGIYEKLIPMEPDKADLFTQKISEIKEKLQARTGL